MPVGKETRTPEFVELEERFGTHNCHSLDGVMEQAEGVWRYDLEGGVTSTAWPHTQR